MVDVPIACTLSPDGMTRRRALIEALAADGVRDCSSTHAGIRVRLRDTLDIEQRTRELIAAESMCCSFLHFDLSRQDSDLVLDISGPPLARPVIERFLALEAASHSRRD